MLYNSLQQIYRMFYVTGFCCFKFQITRSIKVTDYWETIPI